MTIIIVGFAKEQIRIIAESRGILRVRGERLVTSNKWSRFQEEVVVPEECNMSEIGAKFEGGILRITMPKKNPIEQQSNTTTLHEEPPTSSDVTTPNVVKQPKSEQEAKLQDEMASKPQAQTRSNYPYPPFPVFRKRDNKPELQQIANVIPPPPLIDFKPSQNNLDNKQVPHHAKEKFTEDHNDILDSNKRGESKGTTQTSRIKQNQDHEMYDDALGESDKTSKFGGDHNTRLMKTQFNEDGQLLMNMGAAVLVIVALGTYISYSFGFGDSF